ncbi:MAG: DUF2147 domain-containing protein [Brevinema sp.]
MGKWNPFGSLYQTRLYYRHALHRDQGTFWFKDSALMVGLEQEFSIFSRTSLFLYWQPVIAVNFIARVIFEYDFAGSVQMNGPNDDYTTAFLPFTGLNPLTRTPIRNKFSNFIFEFAPEFTFGGSAGPGMVALIYRPSDGSYFHVKGELSDPNTLRLRASMDKTGVFGETQIWTRLSQEEQTKFESHKTPKSTLIKFVSELKYHKK